MFKEEKNCQKPSLENIQHSILDSLDSTLNLDFYPLYFNRSVPLTILLPSVLLLSYTNLPQMLETLKHTVINLLSVFSIFNMYSHIYYFQGSLFLSVVSCFTSDDFFQSEGPLQYFLYCLLEFIFCLFENISILTSFLKDIFAWIDSGLAGCFPHTNRCSTVFWLPQLLFKSAVISLFLLL